MADIAKYRERIGERGPLTSGGITGRARYGARAFWSHLKSSYIVYPGDGAAAGANGCNRYRRYVDGKLSNHFSDAVLGSAVADESNIGAGTPDVEADHITETGHGCDVTCANDARGSAGHDHLCAGSFAEFCAHHATVGFGD